MKACVVLKEGKGVEEDELINWTKEHIAAYKYPRVIEFMDALPMTATGKIPNESNDSFDFIAGSGYYTRSKLVDF